MRTALVSWIPKGVLSYQNSNVVYSTKLQQKLLHSTTLVALGQLQIHSRGTRAAKRAQRLITLEIPVLVRSLKSSNVELG